jgi:hypothetical protein
VLFVTQPVAIRLEANHGFWRDIGFTHANLGMTSNGIAISPEHAGASIRKSW